MSATLLALALTATSALSLPTLVEALTAAEAELGLASAAEAEGWARRARLRGLMPRLDVALGTDADLDVRDSVASSRSIVTTEGRTFGFEIGLRFELGDLVFHEAELRANRARLARAKALRKVRDAVTRRWLECRGRAARQRETPSVVHLDAYERCRALLAIHTGARP